MPGCYYLSDLTECSDTVTPLCDSELPGLWGMVPLLASFLQQCSSLCVGASPGRTLLVASRSAWARAHLVHSLFPLTLRGRVLERILGGPKVLGWSHPGEGTSGVCPGWGGKNTQEVRG